MEILFRGTPPSAREHTGTCSCCKTQVKFKQAEGKVTYDQRDGNYVAITCPVCGHPIMVSI